MNNMISTKVVKWHFVLLALFILTFFLSKHMKPDVFLYKKSPVNVEEIIPQSFGTWVLSSNESNIVQSEDLKETLNEIYSQVLNRVYIDSSGYKIMLSVAYTNNQSDNTGQQSHLPEVCYPAQGFTILNIEHEEKKSQFGQSLMIKKIVAESGVRHEPLTYWTTVGNYSVNDMYTMKKAQFRYAIQGIIPDGLIFRVSSIDANDENAFTKQNLFIDELFSALAEKDKARLGLYGRN